MTMAPFCVFDIIPSSTRRCCRRCALHDPSSVLFSTSPMAITLSLFFYFFFFIRRTCASDACSTTNPLPRRTRPWDRSWSASVRTRTRRCRTKRHGSSPTKDRRKSATNWHSTTSRYRVCSTLLLLLCALTTSCGVWHYVSRRNMGNSSLFTLPGILPLSL